MEEAILGLGTNSGDRLAELRRALLALKAGARILAVSPIYESAAMLPEGAPVDWARPYFNLCVRLRTEREPRALLSWVKEIETALGRKARERWAPREIDIDILAQGARELRTEALTIPHPGLLDRPFALLPFADVAPEWRPPARELAPGAVNATELASKWRWNPAAVPFQTGRTAHSLVEWVGIVNVTPDSFSDGGDCFSDPARALARAELLIAQGATVLDVGAESTRPGAAAVETEEEWRRLAPALEALREQVGRRARLSVDTRNAAVARRAVRLGIDWLNDVSGFQDPDMRRVAADTGVTVVAMHSLCVPPRAECQLSPDADPIEEVLWWGERKLLELERAGIDRGRVILDPGIGFGKSPEQNLGLIQGARRLHALGAPLLFGHSRKSFLARLPGARAAAARERENVTVARERDAETAALSAGLASAGVEYLRVHDVELNRRVTETLAWCEPADARA